MPVKQTGIFTSGKFGRQRSVLPIIPDCTTSATGYFPPKSQRVAGQITGSHKLNIKLHSPGDIKSWHCATGTLTACLPTLISPTPAILTLLFPCCLAVCSSTSRARTTSARDSSSLNPGNLFKGCPVCKFTISHTSSPKPSKNCSLLFIPTLQSQKLVGRPDASKAPTLPNAGNICFVATYHPRCKSKGTIAGIPL